MRTIDYGLKFSLALAIVLIPFRPIWGSYATILLGVVALANWIYTRKWEGFSLLSCCLIAMYIVRVIWLLRSPDLHVGSRTLETGSPLIGIPLIFSFFVLTNGRKEFAIRAYILMGIGLMLYSFWQLVIYFQTSSPYPFWHYTMVHLDPRWFWDSSRYFSYNMLNWDGAHYSFITVMLVYGMHLAVFFENKTRFDKWIAVAYVILFLLFQMYAGSRIGLLILGISLILYAVLAIPGIFRSKAVFASLSVAGVCLIIFVLVRWGTQLDHSRYLYAKYTLAAVKQHPLLGHGTGAGEFILNDPSMEKEVGWVVNHPHNQLLADVLEYGIIGTIPLVAFMALGLLQGFHNRDKALLAVIVTALIFMLTEAPLNSNKGLVPLVFVTSLLFNKKDGGQLGFS
ncbi:MAG TPA: O-antigen ligase family protein [Cyclobacteriaceae bacterium]